MTSLLPSIIPFIIAAALLTITPGLDTALVLRTAAAEGSSRAMMAGLGIAMGCLAWGFVVALGLGALLAASELAYHVLRWVGAAYLLYLGLQLLRSPRNEFDLEAGVEQDSRGATRWLLRGLLTNILNPKVGIFYVSFLPQFIPSEANVPLMTIMLTAIHAVLGLAWFAALILATRPIAGLLRQERVVRWLDRITGGIFVAFGVRLAVTTQR